MSDRRLIQLTEAARRLGVSNTTMRRLVREGHVRTYSNPLDKRQKLVDPAEIERLRQPAELEPEGKLAA